MCQLDRHTIGGAIDRKIVSYLIAAYEADVTGESDSESPLGREEITLSEKVHSFYVAVDVYAMLSKVQTAFRACDRQGSKDRFRRTC